MKPTVFLFSLILLLGLAACTPGAAVQPDPTLAVPPVTVLPQATSTLEPAGEPAPVVTPPPMASLDDEQFDQELARALEGRDFEMLRSLMKDRFSFATYNTQLLEVTSEDALNELRQSYLVDSSAPAARFGTDLVGLLDGTDPLSLWGPVANPVRAFHIMGLGENGLQEALVVIGRDDASGQLYWHGLLVPVNGYFQTSDMYDGPVMETEVQFVMAQDELNLRLGPGESYAVAGLIHEGMLAKVNGVSPDGSWWRVECRELAAALCWVSADPELTEPASAP